MKVGESLFEEPGVINIVGAGLTKSIDISTIMSCQPAPYSWVARSLLETSGVINIVGAGFEENIVLMSNILLNPPPISPTHNRHPLVRRTTMWGRVDLIYRLMSIFLPEPAPTAHWWVVVWGRVDLIYWGFVNVLG